MDIKDKIAIIGVGQTKFGENFDMTYEDMAVEATLKALKDAGVEIRDIPAVWLSTFSPEVSAAKGKAGSTVADVLGIADRPFTRITNYCAAGTDALRNACYAVAFGQYDIALVLGVEKMRDVGPRESLVKGIAVSGHPVLGKGLTAPGMFAMHATRYFKKTGIGRETLAKVAVKNHKNGVLNPYAHFRKEITVKKVLKAPMICWPLGLFDCCPTTDGAAAAVITRTEIADRYTDSYVLVKALGLSIGSGDDAFFNPDDDLLGFRSTQVAAREAYRQAGIQHPYAEIDVAEIHDCFTITEILNYEDLFFANPGEGWRLIEEGRTDLNADISINPSGGLKSCGHPIGATGLRMIVEVTEHLLGRAGDRQVKDAKLGLVHNLGGPGSVAAVLIFGKA
jgi:acetyl-CoA C-acetyltransferase